MKLVFPITSNRCAKNSASSAWPLSENSNIKLKRQPLLRIVFLLFPAENRLFGSVLAEGSGIIVCAEEVKQGIPCNIHKSACFFLTDKQNRVHSNLKPVDCQTSIFYAEVS